MNSRKTVHIFAGPSLFGTPFQDTEPDTQGGTLAWLPPARRGDIAALANQHETPGVIGLADGTFHSYPSVAHVELREAMQQGWLVYGLCSMGALRASEMKHMGMRPFGRVAQMFCDDPDLADDEVALVHGVDAPYLPFSEPMLHIRAYLGDMLVRGLLDQPQHAELVSVMRERWYAERTFTLLRDQLERIARPDARAALIAHLADFAPYRLKQQDLVHFVETRPWLHDEGMVQARRPDAPAGAAATTLGHGAPAFALSSSLRLRSAEESLALVPPLALERGISRVVDTTWLDRLGIPVYAAIRPNAIEDSLNVHAGKGFTHAEAKIGAYMEAIEFSFAEPGRSRITPHLATPQDILDSFENQIRFPEFCPSQNQTREVLADDALGVVEAEEILSLHRKVLVPAELVFAPYNGPGLLLYGANTNGLASGNTVEEATVHGLAEVMERHVESFLKLGAPDFWVDPHTLPPRLRAMAERIERAGMELHLRYAPNPFGLAYFSAYVLEDGDFPAAMSSGMGFHCNSDIAAVRAIAEAAQSRLTTIHGGRDDLVDIHLMFNKLGREKEQAVKAALRRSVADRTGRISFAEVPDTQARSVAAAHGALADGLRCAGLRHLARVVFTEEDCSFQVVRVIVPGAEKYDHHHRRVGPRLLQYLNARSAPSRAADA
jgi:ribosomal protein S12 methylthiotransferase accessory factor